MTKRILLLLFALFLFTSSLWAQAMGPPMGKHQFLNGVTATIIPFEIADGHVVFRAKINGGYSAKIVLDTGFPNPGMVLHKNANVDKLNLQYVGQAMVGGAGGEMTPADFAMGVTLDLPNLRLTDLSTVVMPLDSTRNLHFGRYDGTIGLEFFKPMVVGVDFEKQELTFSDPAHYVYQGQGREAPISLEGNNMPIVDVTASLNGSEQVLKAVIDLGARPTVSIEIDEAKGIVPPSKSLADRAYGMGGQVNIHFARIDALEFGGYKMKDVVVNFTEGTLAGVPNPIEGANLGLGVLSRFHVTFDYPHSRIFLEPNNRFADPFEYNMSGIFFTRRLDGLYHVDRLVPDSPAVKAGIEPGDVILAVEGRDAAEVSTQEIGRIFRNDSKSIMLKVRRGNDVITRRIKLMRLL